MKNPSESTERSAAGGPRHALRAGKSAALRRNLERRKAQARAAMPVDGMADGLVSVAAAGE